jgi:hypothetical protein
MERGPDGKVRAVNHILKDGADSVGIDMAMLRVWINIGCEGKYWLNNLHDPFSGRKQKPLDLNDLRLNARADSELTREEKARREELRQLYGNDVGKDWAEAHRRNPHLLAYLASYGPTHLEKAPGGKKYLLDPTNPEQKARLVNGKKVFAENCAECHSSKQPIYALAETKAQKDKFLFDSVMAPDFRTHNTLSDDVRYSVARPGMGLNLARALGTNAVDGDIWAQLSSRDYKALPPLRPMRLRYRIGPDKQLAAKPYKEGPDDKDLVIDFAPPGGGRGYYRTASLVSMWATAPYLHNNSLGDYYVINTKTKQKFLFPNDGRDLMDTDGTPLTIDTSVEGRMKMFDDAVEKLLWPEKRRYYIKRTETDCYLVTLTDLRPLIERLAPGLLIEAMLELTEESTLRQIEEYGREEMWPPEKIEAKKREALLKARATLAEALKQVNPTDPVAAKAKLLEVVKEKLVMDLAAVVGPEQAAALTARLKTLYGELDKKLLATLTLRTLKIPKGTPVNLYFNLGPGAIPYALKAQFKYHDDPAQLAKALLQLSECPDLIEDKGHTYGEKLCDQDKRDLIEFLKTL